jgi:hypothetical protein
LLAISACSSVQLLIVAMAYSNILGCGIGEELWLSSGRIGNESTPVPFRTDSNHIMQQKSEANDFITRITWAPSDNGTCHCLMVAESQLSRPGLAVPPDEPLNRGGLLGTDWASKPERLITSGAP